MVVGIVWFLISVLRAASRKNAKQSGKKSPKADPKPAAEAAVHPEHQDPPAWESALRPSITPFRDVGPSPGSLSAETSEGYDPCHEDQLQPLQRPEFQALPEEQPSSGPGLRFGASEIVQGFVMSEILKRKRE